MEKKYYYCYSINLLREIKKHNIPYLWKGVNPTTGRTYWVFERHSINDVLLQWK